MNKKTEIQPIEEMEVEHLESSPVIFEQDRAAFDIQIATAKKFPRNVRRATDNSVAIVTMNESIAATCNYAVPRGGKPITGPSVHLARILAQNWGNLRVESRVVDIDAKHITAEAVCFDLETNMAVKTSVKRSIVGKHGRFNDDMITVTGNAACAIAFRNAVFAVIPKGVVDTAYQASKEKVVGDVSDKNKLLAKRKQVVDRLKESYQVTDQEILKAIGKASLDNIGLDELQVLIGYGQAIADGDTTVDSVFRGKKDAAKGDAEYEGVFKTEE